MVCRECGAYNAEHLTHCRVCAAKLRDSDAPAATETQPPSVGPDEESARPARDFVQAPSWPARAFSGASEPAAYAPQPAQASPAAAPTASSFTGAPQTTAAYTPLNVGAASRTATVSQQPQVVLCPSCGKPALAGAPFCPYCGQKLTAAAASVGSAAVSAPAQPQAATPVRKAPAKRPAAVDDDEFDDEDDDFDDAPKKKKKAKAAAHKAKPRKKGKASKYEDDDEFDDEDALDDDEFDDEDAFDEDDDFDDEDDDEFDDMPHGRGKGTKILFWGLILLLVALIAIFGFYIVNKRYDGDISKMFAAISSGIGGNTENAETSAEASPETLTAEAEDLMNTATLTEYTDPSTGDEFYDVDVHAPTGSTVRIVTDAQLKTSSATVVKDDRVKLRISKEVFMPNAPCSSETVTITPNIQVDTPTGETIQLTVSDITIQVPALTLNLTDPASETFQQTYTNTPVIISGTVEDHTVEVYVNDEKLTVYDGGIFNTSYTPKRPIAGAAATAATTQTAAAAETPAAEGTPAVEKTPAAEGTPAAEKTPAAEGTPAAVETPAADAATLDETTAEDTGATAVAATGSANYPTDDQGRELIVIEARKNNCMTARKVITIEPFVVQNMALSVTNDPATGLAAVDGTVTIQGTVTPGAKITASCDDGADITFGEPTVSETGTFSLAVTVPTVGAYDVKLTATQEGYTETTTETFVERAPDEKYSAFDKRCTKIEKDYEKIVAGEITTGSYKDNSAKVTEIISSSPYTTYRVDIGDGKTVVCVHRSTKSKIDNGDVGEKKQIWGTLKGTYTDGTPMLWVWFSKNT